MTVRSTVVRKNVLRRYDWVVEMVTLHLGGWPFCGQEPVRTFLEGQNNGFRQGFPDALGRANELVSDLVDGMLMVVMRCLGAWAPVSRCMPRQ
jgi:hypothetical protein